MTLSPQLKDKKFAIMNALESGMSRQDAYLLAQMSPEDIILFEEDSLISSEMIYAEKKLEFDLLDKLGDIINTQVTMGKESGITWMLERINPDRWNKSKESITSGKGTITLSFDQDASEDTDIVEHYSGETLLSEAPKVENDNTPLEEDDEMKY